jgi:hypothetical protein
MTYTQRYLREIDIENRMKWLVQSENLERRGATSVIAAGAST